MRSNRIPMDGSGGWQVCEPFVLVTPTYGGGGSKGAVPKPVIRFLNDENNRSFIRGVIAAEQFRRSLLYRRQYYLRQMSGSLSLPLRASGNR